MRLTRKLPEFRPALQELLDPPQCIRQADLCEYVKAREALDFARLEVETLGALIIEKLMLSIPVQSGVLKARLAQGRLQVDWGRD
jgi:hypothetical protein